MAIDIVITEENGEKNAYEIEFHNECHLVTARLVASSKSPIKYIDIDPGLKVCILVSICPPPFFKKYITCVDCVEAE